MAATFEDVIVSSLSEDMQKSEKIPFPVTLYVADEFEHLTLSFKPSGTNGPDSLLEVQLDKDTDGAKIGSHCYVISKDVTTIHLQFRNANDLTQFRSLVDGFKNGRNSMFSLRTDESSATQYFQFYGYLSQQQNMLQDYIRTSTYQRAMLANLEDFKDKVILDVGAGSGILSFFAVQAGARKVYAVEASTMATHAHTLVRNNKLDNRIIVIPGKIEEISLPEMVDVIVSEPMGYMLFNERMLETYLHAKKWLLPNGKMFPSRGDLHIAPFSDAALYMEQLNKANFWYQQSFHGVDLASLRDAAVKEYFRQPIVDTFDINICMAKSVRHTVDFQVAQETDLHKIEIPLTFSLNQTGEIHGLAFWFDVAFYGSSQTIWLSTSPTQPLTHWYQVRCLFESPLFAQRGQIVSGKVILNSNKRQSYDVEMEITIDGSNALSKNTLDLKNPFFRYSGQPAQPPPGCNETSPSENYWQTLDAQSASNANLVVNGIALMNGDSVMDAHPVQHHLSHSPITSHQTNSVLPMVDALKADIHASTCSENGSHHPIKRKRKEKGECNVQNVGNPNSRTTSRIQASVPTSSIGGGISPSLFTQQQQHVVLGNTSHFPVSNSLMIGDYATPGNIVMPGQIDLVNAFKHS
ncbi:histone-arginine methyltransferase CARMER [Trichonephila inaurata madagascariensis]|uniref:type I protein arginine methyltransferase n=1 Tax=Trichonephila inaurata madagascariensis TaxID=2747483 RepID=A0A8X6IVW2_9ARAC|nr:histone-arginine methyltransferase CARMER [Trichonephila inaurata madagascariensis]